ncbi:amino acid permease [Rothia sp. ZJ1223]|uniref:amino acid permease n=1 Tax=Rothia sp. ZJ1223 TaxID=2811098 RepID=UPI00195BBBCB|nr:amino acid permease [Rothia sp. ZJ1223]MBM7052288.1 amino acid permease [Rothia sp. ZJ1223]
MPGSQSETKSSSTHHLERKMSSRHMIMLSLGGVIGTGLFLSSGYTINQAGPFGTVLAYGMGAIIVYLVMMCLGELSVAMPWTGSFHVYATQFLGPGTGFTVAILYWLTWTIALGSEFTASGIIMQQWFPDTPVWVWSALFIVIIFALNAVSVKIFAETESWLALIKVVAIIAFIVLGALTMFGAIPLQSGEPAPGFTHLFEDGLFPNGFGAVFTVMLAVNFAFSGTELIGIAAGEAENPEETVPRAIRSTLWRLAVFFIGAIIVMASLIPYKEAGVDASPFVLLFEKIGIPFAADIMNFVVLTAILSAANSGLYASTRMLWSLSNEGMIPQRISRVNKAGVPFLAMCICMVGGLFSLLSSFIAADTVYMVLVSISGLAVVLVWVSIAACHIVFRKRYLAEGKKLEDLKYRAPGYPYLSWVTLVVCALSCVLIVFDPNQRPALFYTVPFIALCYLAHRVTSKRKKHL